MLVSHNRRYDIFQQGNLEAWNGFQYASKPAVQGLAKLVVDPCGHCQGASSLFPHDTAFGRVILPILMVSVNSDACAHLYRFAFCS